MYEKLKEEAYKYLYSNVSIRKKTVMQNSAFNWGISECLKYVEKHKDVLPIIAAENFSSKMDEFSFTGNDSTKLMFRLAKSAAEIIEDILLNISDPKDLM